MPLNYCVELRRSQKSSHKKHVPILYYDRRPRRTRFNNASTLDDNHRSNFFLRLQILKDYISLHRGCDV